MFDILYVDDELHNLSTFRIAFRHLYNIHTAKNAFEGLDILKEHDIKVVISDQRMDGMSGVEFLKRARNLYPDCIRIILTGYGDVDIILKAVNDCGIYRFILKPWEAPEIEQTLRSAIELYNLKGKNKSLIEELSELNTLLKEENKYLKHQVFNAEEFTDIKTNNEQYKSLLNMLERVAATN